LTQLGLQVVSRLDTLWDGLNTEISPKMTLVRRPGFSKYCSSAFGSNESPLTFYSFKNLSGTIKTIVDTSVGVYTFTTSALTSIYSKGTTTQSSLQKVGNILYWCDGNAAKKWDGSTVTNWRNSRSCGCSLS